MAEQYMYKYVLSNGQFYVGRDKVNEFLRAKDHLQNALSVVDKTFYPKDYVIFPGKITYQGFKFADKPQVFEKEWGSLICSNEKSAQQILLPFHNEVNIEDYNKLRDLLSWEVKGFRMRTIFYSQGISSFYKQETKKYFISQLQQSSGTDDDLISIMKDAQTREKRKKTKKQNEYKQGMQLFAQDNDFILTPSSYQLTMWSAVPITFWKNAKCFQLDNSVIERLANAGIKYNKHNVTTLPELLLITNPSLFNNDEADVIESLLTMQAYSVNPGKMGNVNFGNTQVDKSKQFNLFFNGTSIGTKVQNGDELQITADINGLVKALLNNGLPEKADDIKFDNNSIKDAKKAIEVAWIGKKNNDSTQMWNLSDPKVIKALRHLTHHNKIETLQKLKKSEVDKAIQIEQKKIMTLNVTQALGEGDIKEGVDILNGYLTSALNKFFADSLGIESIWKAFAKQKEMLRLTLSEIYYDSQAH